MKILQIHTELFGGGIETFVVSLSNELARIGEDISLCSIFEPRGGCWNKISEGIHTFSLHKQKAGFSLSIPWQIYKLLCNSSYSVVHMHGSLFYYALAIMLLHRRIHFIYTIHSSADKEGGTWDHRLFPVKKFILRHWAHAVTISPESSISFRETYKNCPYTQITNGITLPQNINDHPHDEWKFIHPARISGEKNQLALCEAFRAFRKTHHMASLTIAGEVIDKQIYDQLQTYLDSHIQYIGFVNDINERLSHAGALCLPSLWEGMPIVLLEAMANGCIPICSPVGGIKNVIEDGINGILSKDSSAQEYLQALLRYGRLTNEERNSMRKRSMETAKTMSIQQTASDYLRLYSLQ